MNDSESANQPKPASIATPEEPLDVTRAVWQLRVLVCGLGAALLVLSLAFNVFVWKQNRNITSQTEIRTTQAMRLQAAQQRLSPVLNELARYSAGNPELLEVFKRYGIDISAPAAATSSPTTESK